ncbi:hypothetical protein SASPL_109592 [Salvia splendens]|uniref:CS domain-containing protein n=1 Tax=Salvia splendens TaxID=180675 RepID=A0A8X8YF58_SALSN|nr:hypothetical protein SASPL_109592 [Salvia splendens]
MATTLSFLSPTLSLPTQNPSSFRTQCFPFSCISFPSISSAAWQNHGRILPCSINPTFSTNATQYEFSDDSSEVELRLELGEENISPGEVYVDATEKSLVIRVQSSGYTKTLLDTHDLYGMIKPSEMIWYIDDTQLVVNLKKQDPELKWHDIVESWESLTTGVAQLLKGTSIFLVGESTEINNSVARELAVGLGFSIVNSLPILKFQNFLAASHLINDWKDEEGSDSVAEGEAAILDSLSSQARVVVATLGGKHGAARRPGKWRHLFAGFTIWLSQSEATDEESAKEEVSEATPMLKVYLIKENVPIVVCRVHFSSSVFDLPGKKSLYVRLGCRGDWPDIKPPAWDPATTS